MDRKRPEPFGFQKASLDVRTSQETAQPSVCRNHPVARNYGEERAVPARRAGRPRGAGISGQNGQLAV